MIKSILLIGVAIVLGAACTTNTTQKTTAPTQTETVKQAKMKSLHDFKVKAIDGKEFDLASLKGKKIMIVNVASECGYTPQYENLERLYKEYGGEKFTIIAFPCNDFGQQEPGTNEEIVTFCSKNFGVTFPLMDKVTIIGEKQCELYQWLTKKELNGIESTEVRWNFQKYLIDENGNYVKMVSTKVVPDDPEIVKWIKGE